MLDEVSLMDGWQLARMQAKGLPSDFRIPTSLNNAIDVTSPIGLYIAGDQSQSAEQ
jgi:hypothetical protein